MILEFIQEFEQQLWTAGYTINSNTIVPNVRALISAVSPKVTSVGPAKFINYYLFLDWEKDLFGRLEALIAAQKSFRELVNKDFRVPNVWRMTLPNIVLVALSSNDFSKDAISYVQSKYQIPWKGGEVGQMMLFDLQSHKLYCHFKKTYKQTGSIPLCYAVDELFGMFKTLYPDAKTIMN